jgi:hypothetical protein
MPPPAADAASMAAWMADCRVGGASGVCAVGGGVEPGTDRGGKFHLAATVAGVGEVLDEFVGFESSILRWCPAGWIERAAPFGLTASDERDEEREKQGKVEPKHGVEGSDRE